MKITKIKISILRNTWVSGILRTEIFEQTIFIFP